MDVIKTETTFGPPLENQGRDSERLIPIEDFARDIGISRRAAARHAKAGRIKTKEREGNTYVVDRPPAEKDWFEFGVARVQATAKTRWQIACLTIATLLVAAVIAASAAGVWLWTGMTTSARTLVEAQDRLRAAGEQIVALQLQLADEHRDHIAELEAQKADFDSRANAFAAADVQLARAADQFKAMQALLVAERQSHKAEIQSQQISHAATVDRLHTGISELAANVVELSKAVTDVQPLE